MKLTKELIRAHFGADAQISSRVFGGYRVRTSTGGSIILTETRFRDIRGGTDVYDAAIRLGREMWGDQLTGYGTIDQIMNLVVHGQDAGVDVAAGEGSSFFGAFKTPPPVIPRPSGAHGRAAIASDEMLRDAGLTTAAWGEGLRLGEDSSGKIIRYPGSNSVFVIGAPGVGKQTSLLTTLVTEAEKTSFILLDPKAETLPITFRRRKALGLPRVLCPYKEGLPECCAHFAEETDSYNPVPVLLNPQSESYVANNDALAAILVAPDGSGESKDTGFFSGNAQAAVSGILMQLIENYPDQASLPEMASIVCSNRIFEFAATAMKTGSQYVRDRLATFATPDAPLLKGGIGDILRTMREQVKWLSDPAMARVLKTPNRPWRFDDLKRGSTPTTIFICVPPKFADISRRFFRLLLGCAFMELQSTPQGTWPVTCVADEFPLLGRVQIFPTVFAEGRGHGIRVVAICQNAGQMVAAYGREGFRNFLSCSGVQVFFPPRDYETAEEISRLAGRKSILTLNHSHNPTRGADKWGGISVGETGTDILTPHEVMGMGSDKLILFAPGLVKHVVVARRRNYWDYPEIVDLTDPNPYAPQKAARPSTARDHLLREMERWRADNRIVDLDSRLVQQRKKSEG